MPWIDAMLRGQRVLARARSDGTLAADDGTRVEIRYRPGSGRAYRALARNLVVGEGAKLHPDETCAPEEAAQTEPHPQGHAKKPSHDVAAQTEPRPQGHAKKPSHDVAAQTEPRPHGHAKKPSHHGVPADAWIAYTDGACSGNPGPAGSGVVLVSPEGKMHEGLEYLGDATNNVAELTGILRAIEWIPSDGRAIVVHTDSQYAIGVLQKGWKAKANQELVARTKKAVQGRGARLVYVPGHQGVALNERADELAREAIVTRTTRRATG